MDNLVCFSSFSSNYRIAIGVFIINGDAVVTVCGIYPDFFGKPGGKDLVHQLLYFSALIDFTNDNF